jgi:hypothetical protein
MSLRSTKNCMYHVVGRVIGLNAFFYSLLRISSQVMSLSISQSIGMGSAVRDDHIALESVKLSQSIQNAWIHFSQGER